jgi:hypothetical protein
MAEFALYLAGHAVASVIVLAILVLAFQWLTGFPLRWGRRGYAGGVIGKVLPKNDSLEAPEATRLIYTREKLSADSH